MEKRFEKKPAGERKYYDKMLYMFGVNNTHMSFVERESIRNQFIGTTLCAAIAASSLTLNAFAADEIVYGTMNIPYDKFYAAEGAGSEVDAVTSATTSKWNNKNLTAGMI